MEGNFYRDLLAMLLFVTNPLATITLGCWQKSPTGECPGPE
ncbi:hypothetical protein [Synechocystis sp. LEGE 06083]|nr:hypothetical protein [Synechocystis sp. LEGE 06083]